MEIKEIREGNIKIKVSTGEKLTKKVEVFYNPEMKFDRDLSEVIVQILKPKKICDCLCASGIRGLRYASILPESEVVLNDRNMKAIEFAKKNAETNKLKVRVENKDTNKLLLEERFDYIDIDPFGSPIYFLDSAARSIRNNGIIAMTSTDTAPLCGTSPKTCLRRYGIMSLRVDFSKELGLRILISSSIKSFAKYDLSFKPIFSYYRKHYFRIFGKVERGGTRADKLLKKFDYLSYCQKCGFRERGILDRCPNCKNGLKLIGPIYLDIFAEKEFCNLILKEWSSIVKYSQSKGKDEEIPRKERECLSKMGRFIKTIRDEQNFPPYFDVHKICKMNKIQIKRTDFLLKKLEGRRTHFSPTGIKTKKDFDHILKILK